MNTPRTEDIREAWAKRNALYRSTSLASVGYRAHVATNDARYSAEDYAEFDRWLAEHDREKDAEIARLREFVNDLAQHGVRFDLNPTVDASRGWLAYYTEYIHRIDASIRERAARVSADVHQGGPK